MILVIALFLNTIRYYLSQKTNLNKNCKTFSKQNFNSKSNWITVKLLDPGSRTLGSELNFNLKIRQPSETLIMTFPPLNHKMNNIRDLNLIIEYKLTEKSLITNHFKT